MAAAQACHNPAMPPPHSPAPSDVRGRLDELKCARLRGLLGEILPHNRFYAAKLGATPPPVVYVQILPCHRGPPASSVTAALFFASPARGRPATQG